MEGDKRFSHISNDPRFKRIPKASQKLKIGKRFQSMFKDEKFQTNYKIDKRGKPIKYSTNDDLKKYYELSSSDDSDDDETDQDKDEEENDEEVNISGRFVRPPPASDDDTEIQGEPITDLIRKKLRNPNVDYARGEGQLLSESSSSDDDDESETSEDEGVEHDWGELDKGAETTDGITNRLAACNMDWDRIRAIDLMVLFNSFVPSGGLIRSVNIYPSEFGKKRMQEEDVKGPIELTNHDIDDNDETEEGAKFRMEKLRQYQLNRLKYYYAIIECDTPSTANKIYSECDGMEYESSATKLDLRFVPDTETFDEAPKESCSKMPEGGKYQPRYFTTTALQQANVELTWDETNPERSEIAKKLASGNIDDLNDIDLGNYLASSSGEEDESEAEISDNEQTDKEKINKYKALLQEIESKDDKKDEVEMEISWGVNLKQKTDELIKQKKKMQNLTPFEEYLNKKKEKKKLKKAEKIKENQSEDDDIPSDVDMNDPYFAEEFKDMPKATKKSKKVITEVPEESNTQELELLLMNENDDNKKHFSLKKIQEQQEESKTKRKKKFKKKQKESKEDGKEDDFKLNVNDNRFAAIYNSHHYNIDPADPNYKKTKGMETLIEEKLKRRKLNDEENVEKIEKKDNKEVELNVLIKSVIRKSVVFNKNKKKRVW